MEAAKHRTTTFIDPRVQGSLIRRVVMHWVCFIVTSIAAITLLQLVLGNPEKTFVEHLISAGRQYALFFIVLLALLPAFILDTIRLSHRFAGPIYRLRQTIKAVTNGKPFTPIRFREHDFWSEVANEFNEMMEQVSASDTSLKQHKPSPIENGPLPPSNEPGTPQAFQQQVSEVEIK